MNDKHVSVFIPSTITAVVLAHMVHCCRDWFASAAVSTTTVLLAVARLNYRLWV